jgi:hypothetical protein
MAKPGADGVDVDSCTKKMRGGRVADGMGTDPFFMHLRYAAHGDTRIARYDLVDAEACQWLRATIEEHWFFAAPPGDEVSQCRGCRSPERTDANFAAFAVKTHRRQGAVCAAVQAEIFDAQFGRFISPCSRVVQKKQQCAISIAKCSGRVGRIQQSIDLRLFEIADWRGSRTLGLDGAELGTPVQIFGASFCDEAGERMDGRQTLIATGGAAFPLFSAVPSASMSAMSNSSTFLCALAATNTISRRTASR